MNDWEPPDDIEPEPEESADGPKTEVKKGPPGLRSRADDVLDAVAGRPIGDRTKPCICGGTKFAIIRPLESGIATRRCHACKREVPWASVTSKLIRQEHRTPISVGPYSSQPAPAPEDLDPYIPTFKKKSRSM